MALLKEQEPQDFQGIIGTDGELVDAVHLEPTLHEDRAVVEAGLTQTQTLKQEQQRMMRERIIPGLKERRKDLGIFFGTLGKSNRELLIFLRPTFGEQSVSYLAVCEEGVVETSFRLASSDQRYITVAGGLADRDMSRPSPWIANYPTSQDRGGRLVLLFHDFLKTARNNGEIQRKDLRDSDLRIHYDGLRYHEGAGQAIPQARLEQRYVSYDPEGGHDTLSDDYHIPFFPLSFEEGLERVKGYIEELENELKAEAQLYRNGQDQSIAHFINQNKLLEEFAGLLPLSSKKKRFSRIRGFLTRFRRKAKDE